VLIPLRSGIDQSYGKEAYMYIGGGVLLLILIIVLILLLL
jgi:Tfp pilus assembly protein PilN